MLTGGLTTVTLSSVYIIDLATSKVTPGSDMATPRRSHAICAYRGKVFVFGGLNEQANMLDSSEMGEEVWSNNGNMTAPRRCLGAAALNGKIYLAGFGSSDMDEFDPNTASFRSLGVSIPNNNSSLVTLNNQIVILQKNRACVLSGNQIEPSIALDPSVNGWWTGSPLVVYNNLIHVLLSGNGSVWAIDISNGQSNEVCKLNY